MNYPCEDWSTTSTSWPENRASTGDHLTREIYSRDFLTASEREIQRSTFTQTFKDQSDALIAQRCLPALTFDFGTTDGGTHSATNHYLQDIKSIPRTVESRLESNESKDSRTELLASNQNDWNPDVRKPGDFKRCEKLISGFYLPLGDLNTGLAHVMRDHRFGASINAKKELQGIFNTADEGVIVNLINATLIAPEAIRTIYDGNHKVIGYEYQTSVEPNIFGCCTGPEDSSTAVGKVYSFGKLHGDAGYVNVVTNANGVILTAYPTDQKLQTGKRP